MIRRIVLVRSPQRERIADVLWGFRELHGAVPGVVRIETAVDHGGRALGYDRAVLLTFDGPAAIERWRDHPAHVRLRAELLDCAELLVFEHEVEE
ncbi:MAG: Dabb family protein [Actinomadura sp.]